MKLLDFPGAPNPRRVRIYVAEKGIDLPVQVVDVAGAENQTPAFLAKNPLGALPVLELDDGTYLSESHAICRYLESLHPSPPLFGRDPREAAVVDMWVRRAEWELFRNVGDYFRHTAPFFKGRYVQHADSAAEAKGFVETRLPLFDTALSRRPFLAGDDLSVADITAWVAIDLGIPSAFEIPKELDHLRRWFEGLGARSGFAGS